MSALEEFAKAIDDGTSPMVKSLISSGSVDVNARLPRAFSPPALVHAAQRDQKDIVDILLRANARIDGADLNGRTACHAAAYLGHPDVLALLLARQPNLDVVDGNGTTAFLFAVSATQEHASRCALMLLEAGASLERANPASLCRFAATSTAAIQALLNRGVAVRELRNYHDGTSLHAAASFCHSADVFDMLVDVCGMDFEARDRHGTTCLHSAASSGNVFALRWLLNAGADANAVTLTGSTPLHGVRNRDCAVILLAAETNGSARDNKGRTALHRVPLRTSLERLSVEMSAVHPLIAAGADLDLADYTGETARQLLARGELSVDPDGVEAARREIAKTRLDFVRHRALQVCIGLQLLELDALQVCEVLQFACGPVAPHIWWTIATTVKHFQTKQIQ